MIRDISTLQIRHAVKGDLPALEWEGQYTHFRRLYDAAFRNTLNGKGLMWVVELPGAGIIGQAFVQLFAPRPELADGCNRAYIYAIRVRSNYRSMGIGTMLMEAVEGDLSERGFHTVTLNVAQDNPDARRLYERMGYRVVASDPGRWSYIDHRGRRQQINEPAWRMEKSIR
jgi:ribosomal protein S18 acetylase RimI-like enzyme